MLNEENGAPLCPSPCRVHFDVFFPSAFFRDSGSGIWVFPSASEDLGFSVRIRDLGVLDPIKK